MANQVTVSNDHSISVTIEPPANVQVQISRAVIGTVANVPSANTANTANTVINNAQPNITSVGTLTSLTSNGNITAPFFLGNVIGNISGNITVPGNNTAVLFNQVGSAGASDALRFNYSSNVLTANGNIIANYFIGNGSQLTGIVTQQSNNANYANYANYANVANLANIANTANSVAGANVSGIVANANYSAYSGIAGVANSVAGANVSGEVANATYATTAGTADNVDVANVSGIGNIATINLDGNVSNLLTGDGTFVAIPTGGGNGTAIVNDLTSVNIPVANSNVEITVNGYFNGRFSEFNTSLQFPLYTGTVDTIGTLNPQVVIGTEGSVGNTSLDANTRTIAIGTLGTGQGQYGTDAIAIGSDAGSVAQNSGGIAIGPSSGKTQGVNSIAIGSGAGDGQSDAAIAIGKSAGGNNQGLNSIAIGELAGATDQGNNTIILNATGATLDQTTANTFTVKPVRNANTANVMFYDDVTGEITYDLIGAGANANYANFAGEAFSVSGANVTSEVANANYATYSGTVTTNAQPNITSVGILTGLVVEGDITPNANITYSLGNNTNRFSNLYLAGTTIYLGSQEISANANGINFTGNIDTTNNITALKFYAATGGDEFSGYGFVGATNNNTAMCLTATDEITIYNNAVQTLQLFANNNSKFYANVEANLFIGDGGSLSNITGANVVGDVGGANHANVADSANSVAVGNVSGIGNIATVNLDGNASNILYGNGSFAATPIISNVGNANYANFAGTVITNSQPNITSVGSLTSLTVSGNAIITGNLVVNGNTTSVNSNTVYIEDPVIQIGGGANGDPLTVNDGRDRGTVLDYYTTAPISAFMGWKNANGRFEFASNVTLANNVVTVNQLANISANYYIGNGSQLTGITATTGNANYANFAGQVVDATQSNITTVGNLVNLTVVGNASANSIQLNTGTGVTTANVGAMFWDAASNTVSLGMLNGVTQQIGLESYVLVKASATITDGQAVMFTGANGNHVTAAPADTTSVGFRAEYIIGIATQSIATNDFGYITVLGIVHGLNTNAFNVGDILWVDNATPGALTATRPSDPNFQIEVAAVTKKSAGDGHLQVRVTAFNSLNDLTNVNTTTPTTGQALVYNSANTTWVNGIPNIANIAYSVSGANVSGAVAFATTANSVAVGNVSGIGNIAVVNLTGSTSNVLYGNGVFAPVAGGGGGASIANGNSNVNIATSGGNVNVSIGGTADLYSFNNTRFYTELGISSQNNTPNAQSFAIVQGGSGANGLASTVTNQFAQNWNNTSVQFEALRIAVTDTASQANSILFTASTNNVSQFSINKSGNVAFAGVITGNGSGLSSIPVGNLSANVNFANTAGTVTTAAQPNITSVGTLTGLLTSGQIFMSDTSTTPGRFIVSQGGGVGTGMISNLYNVITQKWNNSSVQFTTLEVGATDVTSAANSLLFNATTNAVSKFSINKSGNVVFAGVMTGDGGGLSNIAVANVSGLGNIATINLNSNASQVLYGNGVFAAIAGGGGSSISNGNSNVNIATANGNVTIAAVGNTTMTITGNGANITGYANVGNLVLTKYNENVIAGGNTGAATLTPDVAAGTIYNYTLTGNITISALGNAVAGSGATLILTQDATGNRLLTSTMKFLGGSKTLSTAANAIDIMSVFYDGTTYYASLGKGFS